ncbi:ribonuclease HI family protein [Candidatus Woesearchaeota archaeon]|nr:ribonuclease HI family protein [Candidatus Woesearchaeota archaeon]HIH37388.1 ribonuclease HI family protein [Candidatus Woesearchaeota archaeon]HIH48391.1 ribonuclease HI family protein [Candidatus Woesearchaeota archaeon]HIJ04228.1 ribonuclease HI family protein [Candidatus Woesearchaeota archaeon]
MTKVIAHADGGSRGNPGRAAIGVVLFDAAGKKLFEYKERIGIATNNIAEYRALIKALELGKRYGNDISVIMDSELIIKQANGQYRVKAKHLLPYYEKVKMLEKGYSFVGYQTVPRNNSKQILADLLVNQALDS